MGWATWTRELSWTSASPSGVSHLDRSQVHREEEAERSEVEAGTGHEEEEMNSVDVLKAKALHEEHSKLAMLLSLGTAWTMCQTLLRICLA